MNKMTPTSIKRGGHNYVPYQKPTHTPSGHYRCPECNRIVRAGDTCQCQSVILRESQLTTRRDDGIKQAYEAAKRERIESAPRETKSYEPKKRNAKMATFVCVECGKQFENSAAGRPPKRCHECRKERQREQWRKRNAAR